jgi:hypothetical protein
MSWQMLSSQQPGLLRLASSLHGKVAYLATIRKRRAAFTSDRWAGVCLVLGAGVAEGHDLRRDAPRFIAVSALTTAPANSPVADRRP